MTNDTMVTIQGWVGSDPQLREVAGTCVTNFRVACTPRHFHRGRQEWVDGTTQWYGVSAWRLLGDHCKRSLHVGDAVVVHGRLVPRTYDRNGVETTAMEIDAIVVGHDLSKGVAVFSKTTGAARREDRPQELPVGGDPWAVGPERAPEREPEREPDEVAGAA